MFQSFRLMMNKFIYARFSINHCELFYRNENICYFFLNSGHAYTSSSIVVDGHYQFSHLLHGEVCLRLDAPFTNGP